MSYVVGWTDPYGSYRDRLNAATISVTPISNVSTTTLVSHDQYLELLNKVLTLSDQVNSLSTELDETRKALNETNIEVQALLDMKKMGEIDDKNKSM